MNLWRVRWLRFCNDAFRICTKAYEKLCTVEWFGLAKYGVLTVFRVR
jgi:hypothetical protein